MVLGFIALLIGVAVATPCGARTWQTVVPAASAYGVTKGAPSDHNMIHDLGLRLIVRPRVSSRRRGRPRRPPPRSPAPARYAGRRA